MHYGIFFFPEGERVISQHTADKSFIVSKTPLLYEKQKGKSFIFLSYRGSNKPGVCDISTDKFFSHCFATLTALYSGTALLICLV